MCVTPFLWYFTEFGVWLHPNLLHFKESRVVTMNRDINWSVQDTVFCRFYTNVYHNNDVIMSAMASQIISLTIIYSTVYSGADQRTHQISTTLVFVWGLHRWPKNSPQKGSVTRKMFSFDDVIMYNIYFIPICSVGVMLVVRPDVVNLPPNLQEFYIRFVFRVSCWWVVRIFFIRRLCLPERHFARARVTIRVPVSMK